MENSTEKLLYAIRETSQENSKISVSTASHQIGQPVNLKKIKKKTLTLGVLITRKDITFVLTKKKGTNKRKGLIKWANIRVPDSLEIEDDGYPLFLGSNLEDFTGGIKGISTWCSIDSTKLKLRNITIPDVAKSKIANAAFWGLKKEIDFDAELEIFDFDFIDDITVQDIKKKNVLAFTAEKNQADRLEIIFSKAGFNLKGITAIPFAIQNFIHTNHLQIQDSPFTIVNIHRENSEVFCFSDDGILLIRNIRTGSFNLVEDFIESPDKNVIEYLSSLKDIQSNDFSQIKLPCESLIEKILRTSDYCSQNFVNNVPMKKFVFLGETDDCDPFMEFASNTIPAEVEKFDPVFDNLPGSIEVRLPENIYEKNMAILAFGIALSSNDYTPNFLYTYNDKIKKNKDRTVTIAAAITFALIFIVCTAFTNWQMFVKNREISKLDRIIQLKNKLNPSINQKTIIKIISEAKKKIKLRNQYISDYLPLAVINEICLATPGNISISSLEAVFPDQNKKQSKNKQISKTILSKLIISGSVESLENDLDSDFTGYILKLGDSKVFGNIEILQKKSAIVGKNTILNFKVRVEII